MTDEERPAPRPAHALGQPLDELSVHELKDRIALLRAEIGRLEAAVTAKEGALGSAMALFTRPSSG